MHALLGHPVYENFVSWCQTLKNSSASFLCIQETYRSSPRSRNLKVIKNVYIRNAIHMCTLEKVYFNWEELKWLQICEFLIEIIFILFLNTTLFYNFMLPVNRYLEVTDIFQFDGILLTKSQNKSVTNLCQSTSLVNNVTGWRYINWNSQTNSSPRPSEPVNTKGSFRWYKIQHFRYFTLGTT
jgi:hypothetical protein